MSWSGLVEEPEAWVLPLLGFTVTQVCFDHAVTLLVVGAHTSYVVKIEGAFELQTDGKLVAVGTDREPVDAVPLLDTLHREVLQARASKDGGLELRFLDGGVLSVPVDPDHEAWTLNGPRGLLLVALPGGELGIWSAVREDGPRTP